MDWNQDEIASLVLPNSSQGIDCVYQRFGNSHDISECS